MSTTPASGPREKEIKLMSGLTGVIRRLKVRDLDVLSNRKYARKNSTIRELLKGIWLKTTDLGIYEHPVFGIKKDSKEQPILNWQNMLHADQIQALLEYRMLSRGNMFHFDHPCRMCTRANKLSIDLSKLPMSGLSKEALSAIDEGRLDFERTLPYEQKKIRFKLLQGADETNVARASTDNDDIEVTLSTLARLTYIEGTEGFARERKRFIRNMDGDDLAFLRDQWQETDIHIDTKIRVECRCGHVSMIELPTDNDFFLRKSNPLTPPSLEKLGSISGGDRKAEADSD